MCLMCAELYANHRRDMEHQRVGGKGHAFDCCTEDILHTGRGHTYGLHGAQTYARMKYCHCNMTSMQHGNILTDARVDRDSTV